MAVSLVALGAAGGGCRAAQPWPLWEAYAGKFLDTQGRVIDHTAGDRSTTEGEAYAMFFALVDDDRARFDRLEKWTEENLAGGDLTLRLPAWSWGKDKDGSWHVLDANPAADADLWLAYDLCEAGRLWNVDRYTKLGELMANRIAQQEIVLVPGLGTTLIGGAQGFHPDPGTWIVNPSYMPPELLAYFAHRMPGQPWGEVLRSLPQVVSSPGGFTMNWYAADTRGVRPTVWPLYSADGKPVTGAPTGSYDAIRVYLWMGMADSRTDGVRDARRSMHGMELYLHAHPTPPLEVDATGKVLNPDAPPGFSAAVVPYLTAENLKPDAKLETDRLAATLDPVSGLYGHGGDYYDQNLALFATGWSDGRFRFEADGRLKPRWK